MKPELQLKGYTRFENGKFVDDENLRLIEQKLRKMKLLAGSTETGQGSFYFDPAEKSYWQCIEYEDYHKELSRVTRDYIQANFPHVDCDRLLDAHYGGGDEIVT